MTSLPVDRKSTDLPLPLDSVGKAKDKKLLDRFLLMFSRPPKQTLALGHSQNRKGTFDHTLTQSPITSNRSGGTSKRLGDEKCTQNCEKPSFVFNASPPIDLPENHHTLDNRLFQRDERYSCSKVKTKIGDKMRESDFPSPEVASRQDLQLKDGGVDPSCTAFNGEMNLSPKEGAIVDAKSEIGSYVRTTRESNGKLKGLSRKQTKRKKAPSVLSKRDVACDNMTESTSEGTYRSPRHLKAESYVPAYVATPLRYPSHLSVRHTKKPVVEDLEMEMSTPDQLPVSDIQPLGVREPPFTPLFMEHSILQSPNPLRTHVNESRGESRVNDDVLSSSTSRQPSDTVLHFVWKQVVLLAESEKQYAASLEHLLHVRLFNKIFHH